MHRPWLVLEGRGTPVVAVIAEQPVPRPGCPADSVPSRPLGTVLGDVSATGDGDQSIGQTPTYQRSKNPASVRPSSDFIPLIPCGVYAVVQAISMVASYHFQRRWDQRICSLWVILLCGAVSRARARSSASSCSSCSSGVTTMASEPGITVVS